MIIDLSNLKFSYKKVILESGKGYLVILQGSNSGKNSYVNWWDLAKFYQPIDQNHFTLLSAIDNSIALQPKFEAILKELLVGETTPK